MTLNVQPLEFRRTYRNNRESIKEITKITDNELTYVTYRGETVTKKIVHKCPIHYFFYGSTTCYTLSGGETIEDFHFQKFDWRNYPLEEIEKKEAEEDAKRIERLKKEGIRLPRLKKRYPSLLDCFD